MKSPDEWQARYNKLFKEEVIGKLGDLVGTGFDRFWAMFIREVQEDAALDMRNRAMKIETKSHWDDHVIERKISALPLLPDVLPEDSEKEKT